MPKKDNFLQKKSVVATFGIIALLAGFYFLNAGSISGRVTGNSIMNQFYPLSLISIIGMLLILCSAILIIYAIVRKK